VTPTPNFGAIAAQNAPPPPEFDTLSHKTEEELQELLDDPAKFNAWFGSLSEVEAKTDNLVRQMQRNAEIAGKTISQEDMHAQLQRDVVSLKQSYEQKKSVFDAKYSAQLETMQRSSDRTSLAQRLQEAIDEAEQKSDKTAETFCEGSMQWSDFVRDFRDQRKLFHTRNAKKEMLVTQP